MERLYGIVILGLGMAILWQGRSLVIGSFRNPGSGLFPALIATMMIILSLLLIIFPQRKEGGGQSISVKSMVRMSVVFVAMLLYSFLLEYLGFLIVSFLLLTLLFIAFGSKRYGLAILRAFALTGLAYFLFEILLKSNLPHGLLGF